MPEPKLLENRTSPFDNYPVRQYDDLFRRGQPMQALGQPNMPAISHSFSDQSIGWRRRDSLESLQLASLGLTDAPGLKIPNSDDQSCSQDSSRSSVDSNRAVFNGATSSSSPHWKVRRSSTENSKQNSKHMRQFLSTEESQDITRHNEQRSHESSDMHRPTGLSQGILMRALPSCSWNQEVIHPVWLSVRNRD